MVHQMIFDEPLKEFKRTLSTFATETNANSNRALDSVATQIFPMNAYAKQKNLLGKAFGSPGC
jgi:hypothetical protein